jgi:hypothetical protein
VISRQRLLEEKRLARKVDYHPTAQTVHMLIDHGLEALTLIDGGTTLANRNREVEAGLSELRLVLHEILDNVPTDLEPAVVDGGALAADISKAVYIADLVAGMLTTDYRRYSTWADIRPQVEEEFEGTPRLPVEQLRQWARGTESAGT